MEAADRYGDVTRAEHPLEAARRQGDEVLLLELLRSGVDDRFLVAHGFTAFQRFVKDGFNEVVQYYLLERGEDLAQKAANGRSLLQLARKDATRQLLRSVKTDMALRRAVDGEGKKGHTGLPLRRVGASGADMRL